MSAVDVEGVLTRLKTYAAIENGNTVCGRRADAWRLRSQADWQMGVQCAHCVRVVEAGGAR